MTRNSDIDSINNGDIDSIFMKWLNDEVASRNKISKVREWDWNDKSLTFESTNKKKYFWILIDWNAIIWFIEVCFPILWWVEIKSG